MNLLRLARNLQPKKSSWTKLSPIGMIVTHARSFEADERKITIT